MLNESIDKQLYDALDELEDLDFSVIENRLLENLYIQLIEKTISVLDASETYPVSSVVLFFLFFESLCFPLCLSVVY
jgi:hypothetical protein